MHDDLLVNVSRWQFALTAAFHMTFPAVGYGPLPAIDGLAATICAGTLAVVTGPSGSGKATLLALLARELFPTRGAVELGVTP